MWWMPAVALAGLGALAASRRAGVREARSSMDPVTRAAAELGISPAVMRAVIRVESGGKWTGALGRPIMRLEAHHIERNNRGARARVRERFRWNSSEPWRDQAVYLDNAWRAYHGDQAQEYRALELASELAGEEAAHRSASWGAFQILGSNHKAAGYSSAVAMRRAYERGGQAEQVDAFVRFVKAKKLDRYLRAGDWYAFAKGYNGPGQARWYADKIRDAVARERRV